MADQLAPGPVPHWPGAPVTLGTGEVFVRSAPAGAPNAEPAVFVHGLGGSSRNWTDLMAELSRPGPVPAEPAPASPGLSSPVLSSPGLSRPVLSSPVLSSPVLSSPVLSSPVLSSPVLSSDAIDLPGFGYSPPPADGDYSID